MPNWIEYAKARAEQEKLESLLKQKQDNIQAGLEPQKCYEEEEIKKKVLDKLLIEHGIIQVLNEAEGQGLLVNKAFVGYLERDDRYTYTKDCQISNGAGNLFEKYDDKSSYWLPDNLIWYSYVIVWHITEPQTNAKLEIILGFAEHHEPSVESPGLLNGLLNAFISQNQTANSTNNEKLEVVPTLSAREIEIGIKDWLFVTFAKQR